MDITIEEKLRLLQKMREDTGRNQNALQIRSQIIGAPKYTYESESEMAEVRGNLSFKVRFWGAVLLFSGYLLLQYSGQTIGGISAADMVDMISETSDTNLFDFSAVLPYTLE